MKTIFKNAKVILPGRVMEGGVAVEGSRIADVFQSKGDSRQLEEKNEDYRVIDCKGLYLAPGFIDLHVHGGGGADFMDGTKEAVETVLEAHAKHGTTAMLPTTLSSSREKVITTLKTIEQAQNEWVKGPRILGVHLEGNFFSLEQAGAQDPEYIIPPL